MMGVEITLNDCAARLLAADNILILTHSHPDGDTIGSSAGLCAALRSVGKTAYVMKNSEITPKLAEYVDKYFAPDGFVPDFVCSVDVAADSMLTPEERAYQGRIDLCIDHHGTNSLTAAEQHIEPHSPACCEIVFLLTKALGAALTPEIALPLYLGTVTDTGCFLYSSVTARTHEIAAELIATGIDFYEINRRFVETKRRAQLKLESLVMDSAQFLRGGEVAIGRYTLAQLDEIGATDDDTQGIASMLRSIEGVRLSILMRDSKDGSWRVSMRSLPGLDCSKIVERIGGGGHVAAAGATLRMSYDEAYDAVLSAVRAEIGEL